MQVLDKNRNVSQVGGDRFQDALQGMVNQKVMEKRFEGMNYTPETAKVLAMMHTNPKVQFEMMQAFGQNPGSMKQAPMGMNLPSTAPDMMQQGGGGQMQGQAMMPQQQVDPRQYAQQQQQYAPQQAPMSPAAALGNYGASKNAYKNQFKMQEMQFKQNAQAYKQQKNFLEKTSKALDNDMAMKASAQRALDLIKTGRTRSGAMGLLPSALTLANSETRELEKAYAELAGRVAQQGGGVMSRARIMLAQAQKPSTDMPIQAQVNLLERMIKEADHGGIALDQITNALIEENGGNVPLGLEQKVKAIYRQHFDNDQVNPQEAQVNPITGKPQDFNANDETLPGWAIRQGVRGAARVGGAVAGSLGDIAAAGTGLLNYATGGATPTSKDIPGLNVLPTSEKIAEKLGEWTKGYTNPQGSGEALTDDIISTFGSIFAPAKLVGPLAAQLSKVGLGAKTAKVALPFSGVVVPWQKALGMATAGEAGKNIAESQGGGPVAQAVAKLAFMTAAGTAGTRAALKVKEGDLYEAAKKAFAGEKVSVKHTMGAVTQLKNELTRQSVNNKDEIFQILDEATAGLKSVTKTQTKTEIVNKLSGAVKKVKYTTHEMPVNDLIQMEKNLNSLFARSEFPKLPGSKEYLSKDARGPVMALKNTIHQAVHRAGVKNELGAAYYAEAKDLTKALAFSSEATKAIRKFNYEAHAQSGTLAHMAFKLMTGTLGKGTQKISELIDILRTPQGRTAYIRASQAAVDQNKAAFVKNLALLDKIAKSRG